MFELIMTYCLAGEPCITETLAIFPQNDVGEAICEIARPAIAGVIRQKDRSGAAVTFSCSRSAIPQMPDYSTRQRDNRVTMADPEKVPVFDAARAILEKISR